jgi:hypothetical protein
VRVRSLGLLDVDFFFYFLGLNVSWGVVVGG